MSDRKKIVVAMSGGVDSSLAAALLAEDGYDVIGAFMKNWSDTADPCTGTCSWKEERQDALRVATVLGIPFETFDFEEKYRALVVEYMVAEYARGRTPNPDVMCNKMIKFDLFLHAAKSLGAEMIATGHYARVIESDEKYSLLAGVDPNKDQSYFLHQLSQEQLSSTLFPIGHLLKPEVRRLAKKFGLPTAEKKDSQGICFIGKVDLPEFLSQKIAQRPGPIITIDGRVVGHHDGIAPFTIGQRHGLHIGGGAPYFVVEKDMKRNTVVVAQEGDESPLYASSLIAQDVHWIAGEAPAFPFACHARIRYRQPLQQAVVIKNNEGYQVDFSNPQRAISPGQFVVFYDGEICLGGGVIDHSLFLRVK